MATSDFCREAGQTWSFRGTKSRNKVTVGEPAVGSLVINDDRPTAGLCVPVAGSQLNLCALLIVSGLGEACFRE